MNIDVEKLNKWAAKWPQGAVSDACMDACEADKDVIILAADLAKAVGVYDCCKYENQYYNLGIMEQNMLGVACGLALEGKTPVATSFVPFLTLRACEQIRTAVCYMNLNVKLIGRNAGVCGGKAGTSHYGLEDITVMRSFPNMTVLSPSDGLSLYKAIRAMIDHKGPAYLRLSGAPAKKIIYDKDFDFTIGKAVKLAEGEKVSILATGSMVANAIDAMEILSAKGINASLYDFHTIKPLDVDAVRDACSNSDLIVTVEENTVIGGFGSAVAEVIAQCGCGKKMNIMGLKDEFMLIGEYGTQLSKNGLLPEQIAETIISELK